MIDQQTVGKILDAAQIVEVVSDFVTLRRRGVNYIGLCPFHDEKTGSFTVSPAKGIFKCFGCGKGGSSVHFIMEHEQLSYADALKYLAKKYHIEVHERELSDEEKVVKNDRESMLALNDFASNYFVNTLHNHREGQAIGLSYFRERGFTEEIIQKFQLGYSLDEPSAFYKAAINKGYKELYIEKNGLAIRRDDGSFYDRFRGRVIFPVHTISGKVVAFGGRILGQSDKAAKYVNSPESEIYHKSNELYGIFFARAAIVKHDRCFLVEGYTDVISMYQAGVQNVVASSGTSLTAGQIRLIHRFTSNITVIYDGDAAGIKASLRGIDLLLEEGLNVKTVLLPKGEDPDSYARSHSAADFIDFIDANQVDFIRFKIEQLQTDVGNDPIKKAALVGDVVHSIALIPNQLLMTEYVKTCSTLLEVDEAILYNQINKYKTQKREEELKNQQRIVLRQERQEAINAGKDIPIEFLETDTTTALLKKSPFEREEWDILYFLVRYGEQALFESQEQPGGVITVGEYIISELQIDGLEFQNSLYGKLLQEFREAYKKTDFQSKLFFVNHVHPDISRLAIDLITDKYSESKFFSKDDHITLPDIPEAIPGDERSEREHSSALMQRQQAEKVLAKRERDRLHRLADHVQRVIFEYKNAIVMARIREILIEMKQASENQDIEAAEAAMATYTHLNSIKSKLARNLGERVIIKLS